MIFSLVNKTINSLSTGYQKHTSHGRDAKFIAATTGIYQSSGLRGGIRPAQGLLLGQLHWRPSCGVKSPPTLHHPTSAGMLSPTECPALPLPLQVVGQRELRNVPLSVGTAYCMPEPGCVSDCPQAWQPNNPLDTKAQQSRAAG